MTERKKVLLPILLSLLSIIGMSVLGLLEYGQASYEHISELCQIIVEKQPEAENLVLSSLKEYQSCTEQGIRGNDFLAQYGYGEKDFVRTVTPKFVFAALIVFLITAGGFLLYILYLNRHNRARITELTSYLEAVNLGTFDTILQNREDAFSRLEDEIYKTVTTLRQERDTAEITKANYADNLANIAHQLKTQITALSLSVQLMKQTNSEVGEEVLQPTNFEVGEEGLNPEACAMIASNARHNARLGIKMQKQLERLSWLEEALLTISRIDAGTLQLERSQVDIYTALTLASENLIDLLQEKNISVVIPDRGCIEICGDMEWTMEAFINVMKNCMEHSPIGGTVHCEYSQNPLYVEILIWDEGKGFEKEDISHLFERFYRGKGAAENGIGIGLSLARSIFELENGNITARNLPGGGACFEIRVYSH